MSASSVTKENDTRLSDVPQIVISQWIEKYGPLDDKSSSKELRKVYNRLVDYARLNFIHSLWDFFNKLLFYARIIRLEALGSELELAFPSLSPLSQKIRTFRPSDRSLETIPISTWNHWQDKYKPCPIQIQGYTLGLTDWELYPEKICPQFKNLEEMLLHLYKNQGRKTSLMKMINCVFNISLHPRGPQSAFALELLQYHNYNP